MSQELTSRLIQISSSEKTIYLDLGSLDGILQDDYAILIEPSNNGTVTRLIPVAKMRAKRVFESESIWVVVEKIEKKHKYLVDEQYLVFSLEKFLSGRKGLVGDRSSLISDQPQMKKNLMEHLAQTSDKLAYQKSKYQQQKIQHQKKHYQSEKDFTLVDLNEWEKFGLKGEKAFPKNIYRSGHGEEFSQQKKIETFEKMVSRLLEKYNDPVSQFEFSYKNEINHQISDAEVKTTSNELERYRRKREKDWAIKEESKKWHEDYYVNNRTWSDEYTDEELSFQLSEMNIVTEKERRDTHYGNRFKAEWYFGGGFNLLDNENVSDRDNTHPIKNSFHIGRESFFLKRFEMLNYLTYEMEFRHARDGTSIGYVNGLIEENSLSLGVNFYPFVSYQAAEINIFYLSLMMRTGIADMTVPSIKASQQFTVTSFPILRLNVKYHFMSEWGIRAFTSVETIKLDSISGESKTIPAREDYFDATLGLSLAYLFD